MDERLRAVEESLREIEMLCGRLERALMRRRWNDIDQAIADSRRATHGLQNAMEEAEPVRSRAYDEKILQRLRYVHAIRENQMSRLNQYREAVGERLRLLSRWKTAIKSLVTRRRPAHRRVVDRLT